MKIPRSFTSLSFYNAHLTNVTFVFSYYRSGLKYNRFNLESARFRKLKQLISSKPLDNFKKLMGEDIDLQAYYTISI